MRIESIDGLRGFMLLVMFTQHIYGATLPTIINHIHFNSFSYGEAAQGFVFLSGLVTAIVYLKRLETKKFVHLRNNMFKRSFKLYLFHIGLLFVCGTILIAANQPDLTNAFRWGTNMPLAFGLGAVLLVTPTFVDILPMFVFFVAATPFVLRALARGAYLEVFAVSLCLWTISLMDFSHQFLLFLSQVTGVKQFGLSFTQTFDLLGWQFIFVAGLLCGAIYRSRRKNMSYFKGSEARSLFFAALFCTAMISIHSFVARYGTTPVTLDWAAQQQILFNKPAPAVLLNFNFFLLAYLTFWLLFAGTDDRLWIIRKSSALFHLVFTNRLFVTIGRNTLWAFSWHVIACYLFYGFFADTIREQTAIVRELVTAAVVLSMIIPVWLEEKHNRFLAIRQQSKA